MKKNRIIFYKIQTHISIFIIIQYIAVVRNIQWENDTYFTDATMKAPTKRKQQTVTEDTNQNFATRNSSEEIKISNDNISVLSIDESGGRSDTSTTYSSDDEQFSNNFKLSGQLNPDDILDENENSTRTNSPRGSNIGCIAVHNSSDITFGNKTYIRGQVVIKNVYPEKQESKIGTENIKTDKRDRKSSRLRAITRSRPLLIVLILTTAVIVLLCVVFKVIPSGLNLFKSSMNIENHILNRSVWLAQTPAQISPLLELPVDRVIIAHTVTDECLTQKACINTVRRIQEQHLREDYGDIGYNFLIGGDGNIYEGRGWHHIGAFLVGQNSKSHGIAFIGDYRYQKPTEIQMELLDGLLQMGVSLGVITAEFKLYGARQWQQTISPGDLLFARLKNHGHFSLD
ncbi:peptidoglycan-recognition protein LA-like [Uranotaenia lowii]|uniref:peptidoglycan-recognition protein LA-like n=1 Tax=Uranotaenia lowii TaxID=190385 RepID=UPI0024799D6E|nr:peptidoglycan-recognition protein LA-like [Uranotaenia lowii]